MGGTPGIFFIVIHAVVCLPTLLASSCVSQFRSSLLSKESKLLNENRGPTSSKEKEHASTLQRRKRSTIKMGNENFSTSKVQKDCNWINDNWIRGAEDKTWKHKRACLWQLLVWEKRNQMSCWKGNTTGKKGKHESETSVFILWIKQVIHVKRKGKDSLFLHFTGIWEGSCKRTSRVWKREDDDDYFKEDHLKEWWAREFPLLPFRLPSVVPNVVATPCTESHDSWDCSFLWTSLCKDQAWEQRRNWRLVSMITLFSTGKGFVQCLFCGLRNLFAFCGSHLHLWSRVGGLSCLKTLCWPCFHSYYDKDRCSSQAIILSTLWLESR